LRVEEGGFRVVEGVIEAKSLGVGVGTLGANGAAG